MRRMTKEERNAQKRAAMTRLRANPEYREKEKEWRDENREEIAAKKKEYMKIHHPNRGKKRKALIDLATLKWGNKKEHKDARARVYHQRDILQECAGEEFHVDHIWPIKGWKKAKKGRTLLEQFDNGWCGLHLAVNMEPALGADNLAKQNKRPIDEPGALLKEHQIHPNYIGAKGSCIPATPSHHQVAGHLCRPPDQPHLRRRRIASLPHHRSQPRLL